MSDNSSVNQILDNIRDVIENSGNKDQKSDLTSNATAQNVEEDVLILDVLAPKEGAENSPSGKNILADIDKMLASVGSEQPALNRISEQNKAEAENLAGAAMSADTVVMTTPPAIEPIIEASLAAPLSAEAVNASLNPLDQLLDENKVDLSPPPQQPLPLTEETFIPVVESVQTVPIQPTTAPSAIISNNSINDATEMSKDTHSILSDNVINQSAEAIKNLITQVNKPNVDINISTNISLVDIVTETLKPMLKEWLEHNLSPIIEKIVEKEIKKLIPKE